MGTAIIKENEQKRAKVERSKSWHEIRKFQGLAVARAYRPRGSLLLDIDELPN